MSAGSYLMKSGKPLWRISVATTLEAEDAVGELLGSQSSCAPAACFDFETGTSLVLSLIHI